MAGSAPVTIHTQSVTHAHLTEVLEPVQISLEAQARELKTLHTYVSSLEKEVRGLRTLHISVSSLEKEVRELRTLVFHQSQQQNSPSVASSSSLLASLSPSSDFLASASSPMTPLPFDSPSASSALLPHSYSPSLDASPSPRPVLFAASSSSFSSPLAAAAVSSSFAVARASAPPEVLPAVTYQDAFQDAGGVEALKDALPISSKIQKEVMDKGLAERLEELFPVNCSRRGFSTVLVNQHYVSTFKELYKLAEKALPDFAKLVNQIAVESQGSGRAIIPPLKGEERARAKSLFKYSDDSGIAKFGSESGIAWYRLTDLVRGTLAYGNIKSMYEGLLQIKNNKDIIIREFNDRFQTPLPDGYRDLQLVVEVAGHLCELQLNTELMLIAKEQSGHRDYEQLRELQAAVAAGDVTRCRQAMSLTPNHPGAVHQQNVLHTREGSILLHRACANGDVDIVVFLLKQNCDVNAQDQNGDTGLHVAMRAGHERAVWALLDLKSPEYKLNYMLKNKKGHSPLLVGYLSFRAHPEERRARAFATLAYSQEVKDVPVSLGDVETEIKEFRKPSRVLVDYAREGRLNKLADELQDFADPDSSHDDGKHTALVVAVQSKQAKAVELLLQYRPCEASRNKALELAARNDDWKIVEILLSQPYKLCRPSLEAQMLALPKAILAKQLKSVELILQGGLPPNVQEGFIQQAADDLAMFELFLEQGCCANISLDFLGAVSLTEKHVTLVTAAISAKRSLQVLTLEYKLSNSFDRAFELLGTSLAFSHIQKIVLRDAIIPVAEIQQHMDFAEGYTMPTSDNVYNVVLGALLSARQQALCISSNLGNSSANVSCFNDLDRLDKLRTWRLKKAL